MIECTRGPLFHPARPGHPGRESGRDLRLAQGLTLVEVIGTLSVIAMLGVLAGPAIRQQFREAEQQAEGKSMEAIGQALQKSILERKTLPGTNDWVDSIALDLDRPFEQLVRTRSGCARRLLYHPACALNPGGTGRAQTAAGFANVTAGRDRILVVSTLQGDFPAGMNLGTEAMFNALWATGPHQVPQGWPAAALPDPDDLQIVRLDLGSLLHRVVINNLTRSNTPASVSVAENGTILSIPRGSPAQPWQRSFIHGTGLNLHGPQGTIASRELIEEDRTFYCTDAGWGLLAPPGGSGWSSQVMTAVADFLSADFPDAKNEQVPRAAIDELYRAMWTYMDWAEAGFLEGGHNKSQAPDIYVLRSTVARLNQGTLNLIGSGGGGP
ncbi:MAG: type II secretion system protein [Verrucomicrobiales bacterium]|nr:type II secretion system protein [Verrucomicrobiales bacterium]